MGGLARNLPRPAHSVMRALARPNPIAMTALRLLLTSILLCLALPFAQAAAEDDFLDPERAFVLSARALDARQVELSFEVAPGYYLYREQFKFQAPGGVTLGEALVPPGKIKFDETFQKEVETHRGQVRIVVPVQQAPAGSP